MTALYDLQDVACERGGRKALISITTQFSAGEFIALCGLNGAGKSTLLEVLAGLLRDYRGLCRYESREVKRWVPRLLAQRVSFLPQSSHDEARLSVEEVVRTGRYPFGGGWMETEQDRAACRRAMQAAACEELRGRFINELSGGERQRVLLAGVLAQEPMALLVDEPGTFIDLPHQIQMFRTIRDLCRQGMLCIAATHDISLAAAFASRMMLLHQGLCLADGTPGQVLEGQEFRRVFGQHLRIESSKAGAVSLHYEV